MLISHQLDELAAETAAYMCTQHPDFGSLAARIAVSNLVPCHALAWWLFECDLTIICTP